MKGAERRLTITNDLTDLQPMSKQNLNRLKNAYKHPFEKIPEQFFSLHSARRKAKKKKKVVKSNNKDIE